MTRTYLTARKSTGGRFPRGQLAPRHQPEVVVEEEPERCSLRLKLRRIRTKCSRNQRLKKIQKKWSRRRNQWSHHSCMMALFWKLMLMVTL
jgi:hypothetical protein